MISDDEEFEEEEDEEDDHDDKPPKELECAVVAPLISSCISIYTHGSKISDRIRKMIQVIIGIE